VTLTTDDTHDERALRRSAFLRAQDANPEDCTLLAGDASFRKYWRIRQDGVRRVLMDAPPAQEDIAPFIAVTHMLREAGLRVPRIYAHDTKEGWAILEDLGDRLFARVLKEHPQNEESLYCCAVDNLLHLHDAPERMYAALPAYDLPTYMREVALFADWYLPHILGQQAANALRGEYLSIWEAILRAASLQQDVLVHRDYHAENLLWMPNEEGLARVAMLDYQDALRGDAAYDLVSLLEDARRDVPLQLATDMLRYYVMDAGEDPEAFAWRYHVLGAQRNCKIIGIFMRLAIRDAKPAYLALLPRVWAHLERGLRHPALAELRHWVRTHVPAHLRHVQTTTLGVRAGA
jgi:aminoglycoside/choline kinase family phosphotransferase